LEWKWERERELFLSLTPKAAPQSKYFIGALKYFISQDLKLLSLPPFGGLFPKIKAKFCMHQQMKWESEYQEMYISSQLEFNIFSVFFISSSSHALGISM